MPTISLNRNQLKKIVQIAVREELRELFEDPDIGLKIRPEVIRRLRRSERHYREGKFVSAEEMARELGL
ncbi:hypothetical protein HY523_00080 [Candidatus Berkelbacteria bacterium]|nr:hypothetical protein [Candidatus Berkelbacteria bacterium]